MNILMLIVIKKYKIYIYIYSDGHYSVPVQRACQTYPCSTTSFFLLVVLHFRSSLPHVWPTIPSGQKS
jgi:hypothetical protein